MHIKIVATLLSICALAALIFVLNNMALVDYFYWRFWWYDIMMHGLGGLLIGSFATWILVRVGYAASVSRKEFFFMAVLSTIAIGLAWEVMEYMNGFFIGEVNVVADTILDIIMDTLGGCLGFLAVSSALSEKKILS